MKTQRRCHDEIVIDTKLTTLRGPSMRLIFFCYGEDTTLSYVWSVWISLNVSSNFDGNPWWLSMNFSNLLKTASYKSKSSHNVLICTESNADDGMCQLIKKMSLKGFLINWLEYSLDRKPVFNYPFEAICWSAQTQGDVTLNVMEAN